MAMAMAFTFNSPPQIHKFVLANPNSRNLLPLLLRIPSRRTNSLSSPLRALKNGSGSEKWPSGDVSSGADLLRKPVVQSEVEISDDFTTAEEEVEEEWVDWEDKILEVTVPIVGFVRMILHSGKYESGQQLSPAHQKSIIERLLEYHPERDKKIGSGIDYITIGYHPEFEGSRCLFIVRKDGELVDFSYWKCIKGLIRKKYPLYADTFILRHFQRRTRK